MLRLRPYSDSDAKYILAWIKDEAGFRMWSADRYANYPISAEDMNRFYAECGKHGAFWGMTAFDETGIVGHLTMRFVDEEQLTLRFGFIIVDNAKRGRGYGKEMLLLALRYAFYILKAERVTLGVFENNLSACWCYKAAGFAEPTPPKTSIYHLSLGDWNCKEMEIRKEACREDFMLSERRWNTIVGMYNRRGFLEELERRKRDGVFEENRILLIRIDIDGLPNINKIYGYSEGNTAIQTLAEMIDDALCEGEIYAHLGGQEFVIALPVTEGEAEEQTKRIADILKGRIDTYNKVSGKEYSLAINHKYLCRTVSSSFVMQDILEELLRYKDISRENVGKTKTSFQPEEERVLKDIIDNNRFTYAFQPIVEAGTGDIYAYEALMRTDTDTPLSPLTILQYAAIHDRLYDIEKATMYNVIAQVEERKEEFSDKKVFMNSIPGCQLEDEDYRRLLESFGGSWEQIVVEVTEQTELDDEGLKVILERSSQDGFGLAIDDYGSGYSNTSSLLRYLPNCVKIDRLLITNIQEEPKKQHFVKSIIEFSHDNGILVLAEGVESGAELKAVIHMGVDLIQGFYTAKPSFELLQELPSDIRDEIVGANISAERHIARKIYMVDEENELPLMRLALEQYTGILLAGGEVTLTGNSSYMAAMTIKVKEEADCKLILNNVHLENTEDLPCIDIGKGAHLKIVLEGDNELKGFGIRVPEDSSLVLEGVGNMDIHARGVKCYGIGNEPEVGVGSVSCAMSGRLSIYTEGDRCFGIGGGIYRQGKGISISGGSIHLVTAGVQAVGIGCEEGDMPIHISRCRLSMDFKVYSGTAIGSLRGKQNIRMSSLRVEIVGSGSHLCGIGSTEETEGSIAIDSGKVWISINGQQVKLLGNAGGGLRITAKDSGLRLKSEGSNVMGMGASDRSAIIDTKNVTIEVCIHAGVHEALGAEEENIHFAGGERRLLINED
ncbi:MAG: GNAT family N-acetyltransferase [Roseburia sp.]|nr:GNAT family N-acetyltransferase [Roseburia sp.]